MIELRSIGVDLGTYALRDINLSVARRQYAVLMGRTGIGKTTLLEVICGLRRPKSGAVLIDGVDVTRWPPRDRHVGYVPQDLALFPTMTVRENLEFAPRVRRQPVAKQATNALAGELGIAHLLDRSVAGLSGGESQRVALGRALAARPRILLLDEPLSALDAATRRELQALLRRVITLHDVAILHVTHNEDEAAALADKRLLLQTDPASGIVTVVERSTTG
ncbi:MAG: ATP-binding cassette domain-containing protein [Planctomycetota bacterium]|nr:MAG: ATP-binding cassette domain-containing protein [Planctomycetota bacterium]